MLKYKLNRVRYKSSQLDVLCDVNVIPRLRTRFIWLITWPLLRKFYFCDRIDSFPLICTLFQVFSTVSYFFNCVFIFHVLQPLSYSAASWHQSSNQPSTDTHGPVVPEWNFREKSDHSVASTIRQYSKTGATNQSTPANSTPWTNNAPWTLGATTKPAKCSAQSILASNSGAPQSTTLPFAKPRKAHPWTAQPAAETNNVFRVFVFTKRRNTANPLMGTGQAGAAGTTAAGAVAPGFSTERASVTIRCRVMVAESARVIVSSTSCVISTLAGVIERWKVAQNCLSAWKLLVDKNVETGFFDVSTFFSQNQPFFETKSGVFIQNQQKWRALTQFQRFRYKGKPQLNDFRQEQCSNKNNQVLYLGTYHTWNSVENSNHQHAHQDTSQCDLICTSKQRGIALNMGHPVKDGTRCSYLNPYGICIRGDCIKVGCDNNIGSQKTFDKCGQCGGENRNCQQVWKNWNILDSGRSSGSRKKSSSSRSKSSSRKNSSSGKKSRRGYIRTDIQVPKGAWNVVIYTMSQTNYTLALKNKGKKGKKAYFLNSRKSLKKGKVPKKAVSVEDGNYYMFHTVHGRGTQMLNMTNQKLNSDLQVYLVEPRIKKSSRASSRGGSMSRLSAGSSGADSQGMPPPPEIRAYFWMTKTEAAKLQTVSRKRTGKKSSKNSLGSKSSSKSGSVTNSEISTKSDQKTQKSQNSELTTKTSSSRRKRRRMYQWQLKAWSMCSVTCGNGVRTPEFQCKNTKKKRQVPDKYCIRKQKRPTVKNQSCGSPCPKTTWFIGSWGHCSRTCGNGGYQTRMVRCHESRPVSTSRGSGNSDTTQVVVHDGKCQQATGVAKPMERRECNRVACPNRWRVGSWSSCSATCGEGFKRRQVVCRASRGSEANCQGKSEWKKIDFFKKKWLKKNFGWKQLRPFFWNNDLISWKTSILARWFLRSQSRQNIILKVWKPDIQICSARTIFVRFPYTFDFY